MVSTQAKLQAAIMKVMALRGWGVTTVTLVPLGINREGELGGQFGGLETAFRQ